MTKMFWKMALKVLEALPSATLILVVVILVAELVVCYKHEVLLPLFIAMVAFPSLFGIAWLYCRIREFVAKKANP